MNSTFTVSGKFTVDDDNLWWLGGKDGKMSALLGLAVVS